MEPGPLDPFAIPRSPDVRVEDNLRPGWTLAGRGARLLASLVDDVAALLICAPVGVAWLFFTEPDLDDPAATITFYALFGVPFLVQAFVQWYLIATSGQTIGKALVGIQIVKVDGSPVDFVSGVMLRNWVLGVLNAFCSFVSLVDALAIFSDDRRCIHDHIAGTIVVRRR